MKKSNKEIIEIIALVDISNNIKGIPSEIEIEEIVNKFMAIYKINEEEKKDVISILHSKLRVRMEMADYIVEPGHKPWFNNRKPDLDMLFWDRYYKYLISNLGFNYNVANTIDKVSDEIIDLLGDPISESKFSRKGLVLGEVQSGKTSNYTALCCKAADAGYKLIILLTGTLENLRRQTQARLDEGFVGMDSAALIKQKNNQLIGVGKIDSSCHALVLTSTEKDFKNTQSNLTLSSVNAPIIVVIKKNKTPLKNLENWLKMYNANPETGLINEPLLLIDDEADNASINTKKEEQDPTQINTRIRSILKMFTRVSYVGFTATPFANIFIDPDTDDEMLKDDLFPSSFIYSLNSPTNYVDPISVFDNEGENKFMIQEIEDAEEYLPYNLKTHSYVYGLPPSMYRAINQFILVNTIRDLRKDLKTHRSMLINASRLTNIQEQIVVLVDEYIREIQREIKNYCMLPEKEALKNNTIRKLKLVWEEDFLDSEFSWQKIQTNLKGSPIAITVKSVNTVSKTKKFSYSEYDDGLKVIVIGGNSLSRGLTLEGLCISYFYRNSKAYDTLMQMGRWFGYRDRYKDLCRIWMPDETIDWYKHIAASTDELRGEIKVMQDSGATPREFGLKVRSHPDALHITARNKMRTAHNLKKIISLSGEVIETPKLFDDDSHNKANYKALEFFIKKNIKEDNKFEISENGNPILKNINKENIIEFLDSYSSHFLCTHFQTGDLINFFKQYKGKELEKWDIVFAQGKGHKIQLFGKTIRLVQRSFDYKESQKAIRISGASSRIGSANITREGISKKKADIIEKKYKEDTGKGIKQEIFVRVDFPRNPLLIIYLVELLNKKNKKDLQKIINRFSTTLVGLAIAIPNLSNIETKNIEYKINKPFYQAFFEEESDEYQEDV